MDTLPTTVSENSPRNHRLVRYGISVAAVAVAALARWALEDVIKEKATFVTFYPAIILAGIIGGMRAALLVTALSAVVADYLFLEPRYSFVIYNRSDGFLLLVFIASGILTSWISATVGHAKKKIWEADERVKQAEELRQSEERFRALVTASSEVLFRMSPDWSELCQLSSHGFLADPTGPTRSWLQDYICPEDHPRMLAGIKEAIRTKGIFEQEARVWFADGTLGWMIGRAVPLLDADGEIIEWFGATTNITARKRAEEAARDSQAKLTAALSSMTDAVFITDTQRRFVLDFNDAFARFHRFKSKEECFKTLPEYWDLFELYMPDGTPAPLGMWAVPRALRGETITNAEYTLRRKDTGETWVGSFSFGPIRDETGNIAGSVIVARDVTERKRAEQAALQSKAMLAAALASMTDGVFITDLHGRFVMGFNDAFLRFYRFKNKETCCKSLAELRTILEVYFPNGTLVPPEMWIVSRALRGETGNVEYNLRRKDTGETWVGSYSFGPVRDKDGAIVGSVVIARDVTERKQAEKALQQTKEELARTNANLESLVQQRTAELEEANQQLRDENEQRILLERKLLAAVDEERQRLGRDLHDGLSQILTGAKFKIGLLQRKLARKTPVAPAEAGILERDINRAIEQAQQMAHGLNPVKLVAHGLISALKELAKNVRETYRLECNCDCEERVAIADQATAQHLYRIAQEAVQNALKHSRAANISIALTYSDSRIALAVHDDGVGFAPLPLNSTGMGLQNMKARAELIGGSLEIQSTIGSGTNVKITMPLPGRAPITLLTAKGESSL